MIDVIVEAVTNQIDFLRILTILLVPMYLREWMDIINMQNMQNMENMQQMKNLHTDLAGQELFNASRNSREKCWLDFLG